jgi:RNA polymerase sigma-70 factor (ECF subfamily)
MPEFHQVYADFQPRILRYLVRLVGEYEAEDLTQEVFVKVSRALGAFRGQSQLSTWIYRIATNAAIDRLRSPSFQHGDPDRLPEAAGEDNEVEVEDREPFSGEKKPLVEQDLFRKEMNQCIRDFLGRLPESCRTVLVLSQMEGLGNKVVAEILGISLNTVKIRLHRAREKFKQELLNHCDADWVLGNEYVPDLNDLLRNFRPE